MRCQMIDISPRCVSFRQAFVAENTLQILTFWRIGAGGGGWARW
jgi:hypothetical protein